MWLMKKWGNSELTLIAREGPRTEKQKINNMQESERDEAWTWLKRKGIKRRCKKKRANGKKKREARYQKQDRGGKERTNHQGRPDLGKRKKGRLGMEGQKKTPWGGDFGGV